MVMQPASTQAPADAAARTLAVVDEHRGLEGPLLPILHGIQEEFGYVPSEALPVIAEELDLSRAEVHGVVTFYHDYRREPAGRHVLKVCRAEACQSMGGDALAGANLFPQPTTRSDGAGCARCHQMNPAFGLFGASKQRTSVDEIQHFRIPHLRNLYAKVGMFGMPEVALFDGGLTGDQGEQVRGFGLFHDGSVDTAFRFLGATPFSMSDDERRDMEQFLFQFPGNYAPILGQQTTLDPNNTDGAAGRVDLLVQRSRECFTIQDTPDATECDLVARGTLDGEARSWLGVLQGPCDDDPPTVFQGDRASDPVLTDAQLRALATAGTALTYTCVPPGSGHRIALDRDQDGHYDRDELDAGSDPADAASLPAPSAPQTVSVEARKMQIKDNTKKGESKRKVAAGARDDAIVAPAPGSADDPRCNEDPTDTTKVSVAVSSAQSGEFHRADLPCQHWELLGSAESPKGYKCKDRDLASGTVKSARWSDGKVQLSLRGKGVFFLDYDLVAGVAQGDVSVVVVGTNSNLCMACPPEDDEDGSDGKRFQGRSCAAPPQCGATTEPELTSRR